MSPFRVSELTIKGVQMNLRKGTSAIFCHFEEAAFVTSRTAHRKLRLRCRSHAAPVLRVTAAEVDGPQVALSEWDGCSNNPSGHIESA